MVFLVSGVSCRVCRLLCYALPLSFGLLLVWYGVGVVVRVPIDLVHFPKFGNKANMPVGGEVPTSYVLLAYRTVAFGEWL